MCFVKLLFSSFGFTLRVWPSYRLGQPSFHGVPSNPESVQCGQYKVLIVPVSKMLLRKAEADGLNVKTGWLSFESPNSSYIIQGFQVSCMAAKRKPRKETIALFFFLIRMRAKMKSDQIGISCTCGTLLTTEIDNDLNWEKVRNVIHRQKKIGDISDVYI